MLYTLFLLFIMQSDILSLYLNKGQFPTNLFIHLGLTENKQIIQFDL